MEQLDWRKYHTFIQNIDNLTTSQKNVLSWMIHKADGIGGDCTIKKKELAEVTNLSTKTIERCFKELVKQNIIIKKKREFTYKINPTEKWNVEINESTPEGYEIFDQIPFLLDMITILSENDKNVYIRIAENMFKNEERYEIRKKMQTVANQLGICKRTVTYSKKRLLKHGMIQVKHTIVEQTRHRPGKYTHTTPDKWSQEILQNILKNVEKVEQKIRHSGCKNDSGCKNVCFFDLETTRKIRHFCMPIVHSTNTRVSLQETDNNNKLSLSLSLSENHSCDDSVTRETLNTKLFKNKPQNNACTKNNNSLDQDKYNNTLEHNKPNNYPCTKDSAEKSFELNKILAILIQDTRESLEQDKPDNYPCTKDKNTLEQDNPNNSLDQNNKTSLRSKLKEAHKHEEDKQRKKLEVKPSPKTLSILNRWNKLCDDYPKIYTRPQQDQKKKIYRETLDSLNKLFRGSLYARGTAVLPQGFEPFEQKFTLEEVETFLERLHIQMVDPNVGVIPFKNRKANIKEFLVGNPRTGTSSKLLSCCWNEPKSLQINNQEGVESMKKIYRELVNPNQVFTFKDLEAFDSFISWSRPFCAKLYETSPGTHDFGSMACRGAIKSAQKVVNGSLNPTILGKDFIKQMVEQRMYKLGYHL